MPSLHLRLGWRIGICTDSVTYSSLSGRQLYPSQTRYMYLLLSILVLLHTYLEMGIKKKRAFGILPKALFFFCCLDPQENLHQMMIHGEARRRRTHVDIQLYAIFLLDIVIIYVTNCNKSYLLIRLSSDILVIPTQGSVIKNKA